jgi:hypothetical protein
VHHVVQVLRAVHQDRSVARAWALGLWWGWRDRRLFRQAERFVFFVGPGFSGHSLVGSLMNAHPDVVVSHELDAFRFLAKGFGRRQLLGLVRYRDLAWERYGRVQNAYSYVVPGQWQGRCRRLVVIGDKKGGVTTWRLADDPTLLDRLRREIRLPLRVVYVTRSPLDNIGSMIKTMGYGLTEAVAIWRRQVETVAWLQSQLAPEELHIVATEQVKEEPTERLRALCDFLGVEQDEEFLCSCAALVDPHPSRSRTVVAEWPPEVLDELHTLVRTHAFLQRYQDDLVPAAA